MAGHTNPALAELDMIFEKRVEPCDVVIMNFGAYWNQIDTSPEELGSRMLALGVHLEKRRRTNWTMPHIIWRETSPQHFPTWDGTFDPVLHGNAKLINETSPCLTGIPWEGQQRANRLNAVSNPVMAKLGIPILRSWKPGVDRGIDHADMWRHSNHSHVSWVMTFDSSTYDCSHWCEPSSYLELQVDLLLTFVGGLVGPS